MKLKHEGDVERDGTSDGTSVGSPVRRREDRPLITGDARYTDDIDAPNAVYAAFLRSQHGHATIESIDTSAPEAIDGVVAVFTAADLETDAAPGDIPVTSTPTTETPAEIIHGVRQPRRPMLAEDQVRYTGEPIAVVVAEDRYTANDAVDAIDVSYETLDTVTDPVVARERGSPLLHDGVKNNVAISWELGDEEAVKEAVDEADHAVEIDLVNQRLAPSAMEPRTVLAEYRKSTGDLSVTMSTQVPHGSRTLLAETLGLDEHKITVRAPDVGGGFGSKSKFYPAEVVTSWCAVQLGRPVKWQATRSEAFAADIQGRGHDTAATLAVDDDGTFRALRVDTDVDLGAYLSKVTPWIATGAYGQVLSNQYEIPAIFCRTTGTFTNKAPMDAYRGAGRPEAAYVVERLVYLAARELDIDPVALRRRNFVPPSAFPYESATGIEYDSGDYERALDRLLSRIDYDEIRDRQRKLREDDRYLGVGIGCFVETAADGRHESATVRFHPSGTVTAELGSADQGQGHRTTFAQILSDELGIPSDDIEIAEGDTGSAPEGIGTFGSRTATVAGTTLVDCAEQLIGQARTIAAHKFGVEPSAVEFDDGTFSPAADATRSLTIQDIAGIAYDSGRLPADVKPGLEVSVLGRADTTVPFGVHAAVIEVDQRTGEIEFERYAAVDDCGVQLNPMIVEGQIHGAIAQGIGQALFEEITYDDNGTLLSDSFQNYALPAATDLPEFETEHTETPSPRNPLGVKGVAESGTISSPVAVVNAIVDALAPFGVDHLEMPVTPETIWRATRDSEGEP